jgi:hypothetical protein
MKVSATLESGSQLTQTLFSTNTSSSNWSEVLATVCSLSDPIPAASFWKVTIIFTQRHFLSVNLFVHPSVRLSVVMYSMYSIFNVIPSCLTDKFCLNFCSLLSSSMVLPTQATWLLTIWVSGLYTYINTFDHTLMCCLSPAMMHNKPALAYYYSNYKYILPFLNVGIAFMSKVSAIVLSKFQQFLFFNFRALLSVRIL